MGCARQTILLWSRNKRKPRRVKLKYNKLKHIIVNTHALDIILIMALVFLIILMVDIFIDIIPGK
jgi:hypothetical protein